MSKTQFKTAFSAIVIFCSFVFGCTKIDTTSLGQNLIPVVDNIHTFDTTLSVIAINYAPDECDTIHRSSLIPLGMISNDPLFGTSKASIYVEMKPSGFPYNFPAADANSLVIDSVVLVMSYSHTFGDTSQPAKVNVYQLSDSFHVAQNYTTCVQLPYDSSFLLGSKDYVPYVLKDSVHAYKEDAANQLRVPLSASFFQNFIADSALIFRSDSAFINYFKGFAIVPDAATGGQSLNYFDFTNSRVSLYMRYKNGTTLDTTVVNFAVSGLSGLSNSLIRDRSNSEIAQHLTHPAAGDSLLYIQTSPGTYALLKIPSLSGWSGRVINRAEIIVDQLYSTTTLDNIFAPPVNLYVDAIDSSLNNGSPTPIPCDFSSSELQTGFNYMGGQIKTVTDSLGQQRAQYVFNISRYLQSTITRGSNNLTLRLSAPDFVSNKNVYSDYCGQTIGVFSTPRNNLGEGRVKLNGTNQTPTRIRLHVIYSKL